jgi:hypothetical protein
MRKTGGIRLFGLKTGLAEVRHTDIVRRRIDIICKVDSGSSRSQQFETSGTRHLATGFQKRSDVGHPPPAGGAQD